MSMSLNFEPDRWYKHFAIKKEDEPNDPCNMVYEVDGKYCLVHKEKIGIGFVGDSRCSQYRPRWSGYMDDGNTYRIVEFSGETWAELQQKITDYWKWKGQ